jgi:hypothetical protein
MNANASYLNIRMMLTHTHVVYYGGLFTEVGVAAYLYALLVKKYG